MTDRRFMTDDLEDSEELSFELQEMLGMLSRLDGVGDLAEAASNEYGDALELSGFDY